MKFIVAAALIFSTSYNMMAQKGILNRVIDRTIDRTAQKVEDKMK